MTKIVNSDKLSRFKSKLDEKVVHKTDVIDNLTSTSTNAPLSAKQGKVLNDDKAEKNGYYEQLGAGYAKNLMGNGGAVSAEFTRRTSGGSADIGNGVANLKTIKGNTIVWNQLVQNGNFASDAGWRARNGNISISNNKAVFTATDSSGYITNDISPIVGHKIYISVIATIDTNSIGNNIRVASSWSSGCNASFTLTKGVRTLVDAIITSGGGFSVYAASQPNDITTFEFVKCIDLTQMFGAGNEPTTVAEFKALFPLDYYEYNAGELVSLTANKLKTIGFNQWDGKAYEGGLSEGIPFIVNASQEITSPYTPTQNWYGPAVIVKCFPNTTYYIKSSLGTTYCKAASYAKYEDITDRTKKLNLNTIISGNGTFTTAANAQYIVVQWTNGNTNAISWSASDICINISWSGVRNGEYEPYEEHEINLPITTHFTNGMWSNGSTYDELTATNAIQRCGKRAYQSGDENDSSVITDMTNTIYTLADPVVTTFAEPLNLTYQVNDFGTEEILPTNDDEPTTAPIKADIVYAPNVQDTIRRLPSNYEGITDYKTGIGNLATKLGTALNKTISVTWSGDNSSVCDFTITDNDSE